jgi:CheY-like chemotaxis protein
VLVIDNDPVIQDLMMWALFREGYAFFAAYNGIDGINRAKELLPGIIILDIDMPGMDGWEVLTKLKEDPKLSSIPIIILSMVDDKMQEYSWGLAEYLPESAQEIFQKGLYTRDELIGKVTVLIKKRFA